MAQEFNLGDCYKRYEEDSDGFKTITYYCVVFKDSIYPELVRITQQISDENEMYRNEITTAYGEMDEELQAMTDQFTKITYTEFKAAYNDAKARLDFDIANVAPLELLINKEG